jgi:hypothetical protein
MLLLTQAFGCGGFLKFAEKVAIENTHFANSVIIAHKDGFVDDAGERTLLTASKQVAKYDDAAVDAFAAQNKPGALAQIDQALATIDTDIANGIAGIKNPDKQLEIQAIVAGLRSLIITAKAYVQGAR